MRTDSSIFVNIASNANSRSGFGAHARGFTAAFSKLEKTAAGLPDQLSTNAPTIWIGTVYPVPSLPGYPKIGWVTWETTRVPQPFAESFRQFDQLWVPSGFCEDLLTAAVGTIVPIKVVPEGVDALEFLPPSEPRSKDDGPFRFLSVGKWEVRKGHDILVRAFLRAFCKEDNVELYLRLTPSIRDTISPLAQLKSLINEHGGIHPPRIHVIPPTGIDGMAQLYRNSHAFVLATRSEAWGLPILEAMATGLPCVVTEYGGHLDYCTSHNTFLVRPKGLAKAHDPMYFPANYDWGEWANPDLEGMAEIMRSVWVDYDHAVGVGQRAREDTIHQWTWKHSAENARVQLLEAITGTRGESDSN